MRPAWLAAAAVIAASPAYAHHSFAMFDLTRANTLVGTVTQFSWENPHCWLELNVPVSGSQPRHWSVEMGGPSGVYKGGWRQDVVKPGDKIAVVIHPLRDGRPGGSIVSATLASGKVLTAGGGAPSATVIPPAPRP